MLKITSFIVSTKSVVTKNWPFLDNLTKFGHNIKLPTFQGVSPYDGRDATTALELNFDFRPFSPISRVNIPNVMFSHATTKYVFDKFGHIWPKWSKMAKIYKDGHFDRVL